MNGSGGGYMDKNLQKQMAEKLLEASEDKINRNIKDSVFCDLFSKDEYLIQLYKALHPEDTEMEADDLTIVTLSRIIVREMYNDLGFLAGNRLVVLVEAQSSWSENIVVRFLMYLGETYHRYIEKNELDLYTTKKVVLPKPELYVIYTGDRQSKPDKISFKQSFFRTDDCCVEIEAKVIYDSCPGDIINQFIVFSKVFDEQRRLYPDDKRKAVRETIRICKEKDVLKSYLEQEEAAAVMFTFADQEQEFNRALRKEREEGELTGERRGAIREAITIYDNELDLSLSEIITIIMNRFSLTKESAEQYVESTLDLQKV
jgi:hypothetical protein